MLFEQIASSLKNDGLMSWKHVCMLVYFSVEPDINNCKIFRNPTLFIRQLKRPRAIADDQKINQ